MKNLLFITILPILILVSCTSQPVMVACVGDSITAGSRLKKQSETAYPKVIGNLLGDDYTVVNCGRSGATALKVSNHTYWSCNEISNVFAIHPDIITIKLGTNDSKPQNWDANGFKSSYQSLIDTFLTIKPTPKIYLCLPVPVFENSRFAIDGDVVENEVVPIIKGLAKENDVPIVDLFQPFKEKGALFPDGVHPNEEGAAQIAGIIAKQIEK